MNTQEPHPHALESLLTVLVPGFTPEISIAEQPGQDAEYQGSGAHSASWGIGAAPRSVTVVVVVAVAVAAVAGRSKLKNVR